MSNSSDSFSSNSTVDTFLERITTALDSFMKNNLSHLKVAVEGSVSILNNSRKTLKIGARNIDLSEPSKRSYQHEDPCCTFGNSSANSIDCHFHSAMKGYLTALHSEQDESFLSYVKALDEQNSSVNAFDEESPNKGIQIHYFSEYETNDSKPVKKRKISVCESQDPVPEPGPLFSKQNVNISHEISNMSFMEESPYPVAEPEHSFLKQKVNITNEIPNISFKKDEGTLVKPALVIQEWIHTLESLKIIDSRETNSSKVNNWKQFPPLEHKIRALKVANAFTSKINYICSVIHELTTDAKTLENFMKHLQFAYECVVSPTDATKRKLKPVANNNEMEIDEFIPTLEKTKVLVSKLVEQLTDYFKTVIKSVPKKWLDGVGLIKKDVDQKYLFLKYIYDTLKEAGSTLKLSVFLDKFEKIALYLNAIQDFHNKYHKTDFSSGIPEVVDLTLS